MYLYVKLGYNGIIFKENVDGVIKALGHAAPVREEGYGVSARFSESSDELEIKLIPTDDVRLVEAEKPELLKEVIKLTQEVSSKNSEIYKLTQQVKKFEDLIKVDEEEQETAT